MALSVLAHMATSDHRCEPKQQVCGACSSLVEQDQPCSADHAALKGLLERTVSPTVKASPSKPGAPCDMAAEHDPVPTPFTRSTIARDSTISKAAALV